MEFAQRLLSTRRGSTVLGIAAAVMAGILLLAYLNQYRNSVRNSAEGASVLVAGSLIEKGTPGDLIGSEKLFTTTKIRKDQIVDGAFTDARSLKGQVARDRIFPNQQLTASDFVAATATTLSTKLTGTQRAIAIPLDTAHGLIGQLQPGDHVDVLAGFDIEGLRGNVPVIKTLIQNALVLKAPAAARRGVGGADATVTIRATAAQVAQVAFAVDNGRIWLVQLPSANAKSTKSLLITTQSLLIGAKPLGAAGGAK